MTKFFWLHIKKSAGTFTKNILQPHYIQSHDFVYNEILNNFRVDLGEYNFKRTLFAKNFFYKDKWNSIYSFAFSREPIDRAISMYFYLFRPSILSNIKQSIIHKRLIFNNHYRFDIFLDLVQQKMRPISRNSLSSQHFIKHTATMFEDISDYNDKVLLTRVYRLENIIKGINEVFNACGIKKTIENNNKKINKNPNREIMTPSKSQLIKIRNIYEKDFELYENAI